MNIKIFNALEGRNNFESKDVIFLACAKCPLSLTETLNDY